MSAYRTGWQRAATTVGRFFLPLAWLVLLAVPSEHVTSSLMRNKVPLDALGWFGHLWAELSRGDTRFVADFYFLFDDEARMGRSGAYVFLPFMFASCFALAWTLLGPVVGMVGIAANASASFRKELHGAVAPLAGRIARPAIAAALALLVLLNVHVSIERAASMACVVLGTLALALFWRATGEARKRVAPVGNRIAMHGMTRTSTVAKYLRAPLLLVCAFMAANGDYETWDAFFTGLVILLAVPLGAWTASLPTPVEIGADGIRVGRFFHRVTSFTGDEAIVPKGAALTFVDSAGHMFDLLYRDCDSDRRDVIASRISETIEAVAHARRRAKADGAIEAMAAAYETKDAPGPTNAGAYRVASLSRDALWDLAEAPWVGTRARIGAIRALEEARAEEPLDHGASDATDAVHERLLRIGERSVDPAVRDAIGPRRR